MCFFLTNKWEHYLEWGLAPSFFSWANFFFQRSSTDSIMPSDPKLTLTGNLILSQVVCILGSRGIFTNLWCVQLRRVQPSHSNKLLEGLICCSWAGFTQGLSETHAKTPANAQYHAKHPVTGEFLHLAKQIPCAKPSRDPCNDPNTYKSVVDTPNLWPGLQTKGSSLHHNIPHHMIATLKSTSSTHIMFMQSIVMNPPNFVQSWYPEKLH